MGLFGWLTGTDKYGAARSALIAKYTFEQLPEGEKNQVKATAYRVLEVGGYPVHAIEVRIAKLKEYERYCLYAMAMAMAGVKPALKSILYKDQWYPINNPFVALINAEKQIRLAQYEIKKKHNIQIDWIED